MALAATIPGRGRRARVAVVLLGLGLGTGCPPQGGQPAAPAGATADTACPKDFPTACKVLKDETDVKNNSVEYHVLVPPDTRHADADKLLQSLYRHLMTRRDSEPAALSGYLYTNEVQFSTPPASPVASMVKRAEAKIPIFENKIELELWQQVEEALELSRRADRKLKRQLTYRAEGDSGRASVSVPFTESGKEDWAPQLSFNQAMNQFTDVALALFSRAPGLKLLHFVGVWKDQEVVRIELSRADFNAMQLRDVEERIGSLHGRAFQELALQKGSDESVARSLNARAAGEYRKILAQLKGRAFVSPQLK